MRLTAHSALVALTILIAGSCLAAQSDRRDAWNAYRNRTRCVGRDYSTIEGKVISTWVRRDECWKETNDVVIVSGGVTSNPWKAKREELAASVEEWKAKSATYAALAEKRKERLDAISAKLAERKAEYEAKYTSGTLVTKPIYKLFITVIEGLEASIQGD